MTRYLPNKSIRDEGIETHLKTLGIPYDLFVQFVEARIPVTKMRLFFKKADGKLYARPTIAHWVKVYKEGKS